MAVLMSLGAVLGLSGACADDSGDGSGGGVTTTSTTSKTSTGGMGVVSTYGVGTTGNQVTTGGCDSGIPNALGSQLCQDCIDCAVMRSCADELAAYEAHPDAAALDACLDACEDPDCIDACADSYPRAVLLYEAVFACTVCDECTVNCDAEVSCN